MPRDKTITNEKIVRAMTEEFLTWGYERASLTVSPAWTLPVVIVVGIAASVIISNLTVRLFRLDVSNE